jgi:hypothetical protein
MIHADMLHFSAKGRNTRIIKTTLRQDQTRQDKTRHANQTCLVIDFSCLLLSCDTVVLYCLVIVLHSPQMDGDTSGTARRKVWQRGQANYGREDTCKVRKLVQKATVTRVEDALKPLQTLGFAILEDMTEAFAPRNRCTKKQRDFIKKCKTPYH